MGCPVKDKCYADKPDTIDALKDNIHEAIGEIQLHTVDNVHKNWTYRVGYCMANYFPLLTGRIVTKKFEEILSIFFKAFSKKRHLADPVIFKFIYLRIRNFK